MKMATVWIAGAVGMVMVPATAAAQEGSDQQAVRRAALDYLEGFYEGDTDKIRRGIHPEVIKYGFFVARDQQEYSGEPMSFQEMLDYATRVKERENYPDASAPKEVIVLDVQDQTAAVKVIAWWGADYLHLAKYDGHWKIIHVLWQTPPPGP